MEMQKTFARTLPVFPISKQKTRLLFHLFSVNKVFMTFGQHLVIPAIVKDPAHTAWIWI